MTTIDDVKAAIAARGYSPVDADGSLVYRDRGNFVVVQTKLYWDRVIVTASAKGLRPRTVRGVEFVEAMVHEVGVDLQALQIRIDIAAMALADELERRGRPTKIEKQSGSALVWSDGLNFSVHPREATEFDTNGALVVTVGISPGHRLEFFHDDEFDYEAVVSRALDLEETTTEALERFNVIRDKLVGYGAELTMESLDEFKLTLTGAPDLIEAVADAIERDGSDS